MFLIDRSKEPDEGGRKFRRFRGGIPFWLQALAIVLATLLLAGLHFGDIQKVGRIAAVLDSSASVTASRDDLLTALDEKLRRLSRGVQTTEFTVLDSFPGARPIYHGTELIELAAALEDWQPTRNGHDPNEALNVARSLIGDKGLLIFATDHKPESETEALPLGVNLLAVGKPRDNVGFLGIDVRPDETGTPAWAVVVRNYSDVEARRSWQIEVDGTRVGEERAVTIPPDGAVTLRGGFPDGETPAITLVLEPDEFPVDDRLPIVRPVTKEILVSANIPRDSRHFPIVDRLVKSLPDLRPVITGETDVGMFIYWPLEPREIGGAAVVFLEQGQRGKLLTGGIVVANHPLMEGLTWQSLIVPDGLKMPVYPTDTVLAWAGEKPLILLRESGAWPQLLFNFDLSLSNADKLPAFAILCHRFLSRIRDAKVFPESRNIELAQRFKIAYDTNGPAPILQREGQPPEAFIGLSPNETGFFTVKQGDTTLLHGAAHFGDPREADLRECETEDTVPNTIPSVIEEARRDSPWWRAFLIIALIAVALAWHFQARSSRRQGDQDAPDFLEA